VDPNPAFFVCRVFRQACGKTRNLEITPHRPVLGCGSYNVRDVIREFTKEDFDTLWRLDQECFSTGIAYSRQELGAYIRHRGAVTLLAVDAAKGKTQGFIVAHPGPVGHIVTIDVTAAARRAGVGSALLQAAEDRLRAAGSRAVGLETAVDNLAALAFYKRHGYSVVRTWPRYYSNGVDALVLEKDLKP
jgi:[ribosomal protein S18]-alanine N-acetyltransferase